MQLRIAVLRSELQRQRKALGREIDLRQKERAQFQKKGKTNENPLQQVITQMKLALFFVQPHMTL